MTSGGGVVVTNDKALAERARKFAVLGYTSVGAKQSFYKASKDTVQLPNFERHEFVGYNYRLPEVCAAMALAPVGEARHASRQKVSVRCAVRLRHRGM